MSSPATYLPPALGTEFGPYEREWTARETQLYALGVGAGLADATQDVHYTTDNTRGSELRALPTFASVLGLPGAAMRWSDIGIHDVTGLVHGEHHLQLHAPVPTSGRASVVGRLLGAAGAGSSVRIELAFDLVVVDVGHIATNRMSLMLRGATLDDDWMRNQAQPDTAGAPRWQRPERAPDAVVDTPTAEFQALLYRLSGDRNRIHGDPSAARRAGFERPILQGLSTFGFAGRAVVGEVCGGDEQRLVSIAARFAKPVYPGTSLRTSMWVDGDAATFETIDGWDAVVLSNGRATFRPAS
jgi:acyl dehydratase